MRGLKIDVEGNIEVVTWDVTKEETLRVMQRAVEGLVDVVCLEKEGVSIDMWLNDEGLYLFEMNPLATYIADTIRGRHYQNYHGPVLFLGGPDEDGDTTALSGADEKLIRRIASEVMV